MAALGQGVDALSIAAPVLKSGPSAYETTIARMGIEGDNAKLAAAKDAEKEKEKAARGKAFEMDLGTVELPDTIAWNKRMADEQATYAEELQAFEEGKGEDPDDPRSLAGQKRMARLQGQKQWVSNSKQKVAHGNTLLGLIRANKHAYADGAEEAVLAWMSDPSVNDTGELIDPAEQYYNLDADLKATLGDLAASGYEKAQRDANGDVLTTGGEYIIPEDVLGGVKLVLQKPAASKEARRRFEALAQRDPKAAEQIAALAKKNNIPAEAAMIWNEAAKVYGYSKSTQSLAQQSEGAAGRAADDRGSLWFGKLLEGYMDKSYGTEISSKDVQEGSPGYEAIQIKEEDLPGWRGYYKKVPTNLREDKTLKGFKWDDKIVFDKEAKTQVRTMRDIKKVVIDDDNQRLLIGVGPAGQGRKADETIEVPFEEAESKMGPKVLGFNKDLIRAQGGYDLAAEKTGEGTRKEAGAGNIVKTPTTAQPKAKTTFIP